GPLGLPQERPPRVNLPAPCGRSAIWRKTPRKTRRKRKEAAFWAASSRRSSRKGLELVTDAEADHGGVEVGHRMDGTMVKARGGGQEHLLDVHVRSPVALQRHVEAGVKGRTDGGAQTERVIIRRAGAPEERDRDANAHIRTNDPDLGEMPLGGQRGGQNPGGTQSLITGYATKASANGVAAGGRDQLHRQVLSEE